MLEPHSVTSWLSILDHCAHADMVEHVESSFQHNSNGATVFATKFLGSPKFSSYKVCIWPSRLVFGATTGATVAS